MNAKMAPFVQLTRFIVLLQVLSTGFCLRPELDNKVIAFNFTLFLKRATPSIDTSTSTHGDMLTSTHGTTGTATVTSPATAPVTATVTATVTAPSAPAVLNATDATNSTASSTPTEEPYTDTTEDNSTASLDATVTSHSTMEVTSPSSTESTSLTESTTASASGPEAMSLVSPILPDTDELIQWLTSRFNSTIGFSRLNLLPTTGIPSSLGYSVTYNVAELSDAEALGTDGKLAKELRNIAKSVSDESRTFNGSWVVDKQATQQAMDKAIASATAKLKSICTIIGPVCKNVNFSCSQKESGSVMCVHRCTLFLQKNQCEKQGFLAKGKCMLDEDSLPYCNCGHYLLLDNFYTGNKCLNVSLIVGIAAGGSFLLLLTCIIAICCLVSKMRKCRAKRSGRSTTEHKSCFDPPPVDYADGGRPNGRGNGRIAYPPQRDEARMSSDKRCRSILDDNTGHMNPAFHTGGNSMPADVDPTQSEAYKTFFPNLEVVDTTLKYAIKRPNVMIRPTNNYAHVRQHGYAEERL